MRGNLSNFDIQTYRKFLIYLKTKYRIIPFCRFSKRYSSFLVLRHDVHSSLDAAFQMARLERELRISSTYLVYVSNRFYSLPNSDDLALLRRICEMGHEIGLHYDLEEYRSYNRPIKETLLTEIHTLESLTRSKVSVIAMHNRSLYESDPFAEIDGIVNAYSFNRDHNAFYVSDSCRAWRIEDTHKLISENPRRVQLLIHPFHWIPKVRNRYSSLDALFKGIDHRNRQLRSNWQDMWRRIPYVIKYDRDVERLRSLLEFGT